MRDFGLSVASYQLSVASLESANFGQRLVAGWIRLRDPA